MVRVHKLSPREVDEMEIWELATALADDPVEVSSGEWYDNAPPLTPEMVARTLG